MPSLQAAVRMIAVRVSLGRGTRNPVGAIRPDVTNCVFMLPAAGSEPSSLNAIEGPDRLSDQNGSVPKQWRMSGNRPDQLSGSRDV